ncbi:unnamed protein product [Rotaria sp. Silwood1]|nr:unnamed protein product [Rotaria sp. Silwood1]CAF4585703.1 unnamed protein product [Rotaria sp. Silwood1]
MERAPKNTCFFFCTRAYLSFLHTHLSVSFTFLFIILKDANYGYLFSISPCAIWNTTGLTIAGSGVSGSSPRQLSYPQGIFIHDKKKLLYVSDSFNNRIQTFPLDQSTTTGAKHGIQIGNECRGCTGVWLDKEKNVYMSEHDRHRTLKWSPITNVTTIVAGETDKKGPRSDHLNEPQGIFVDITTEALYIADLINHRIQKWPKGAKEGVTVAGSSDGDPGSDAKSLDRPYGLRVDEETKTVYVVDLLNNRIQRWKNAATEGETIAGGNGQGNASNQFFHPTDLAFDNQGNLYVSEGWNHRVQFFALIDNRPCYVPSTGNSIIFFVFFLI